MPKISVVMAVYNGLPYLPQAMESILNQTLMDFEFIVVEDASLDDSLSVLRRYNDKRIRLIVNKKNLGLSRSLNKGLDAANGEYVARMDHDDISLPTRLAEQKAYLDTHPQIDVVGTWAQAFGLNQEQLWRYPVQDEEIRAEMLFYPPIVHSSAMLRRMTFKKHKLRYDPKTQRAQDYELWARATSRIRFANLSKVLLWYRIHPDQIGRHYGADQQASANNVRAGQLREFGLHPCKEELVLHNAISAWKFQRSQSGLRNIENWLLKLRKANQKTQRYPVEIFNLVLEKRWWAACRSAVNLGLDSWNFYKDSPLSVATRRGAFETGLFWVKCHLREQGLRR